MSTDAGEDHVPLPVMIGRLDSRGHIAQRGGTKRNFQFRILEWRLSCRVDRRDAWNLRTGPNAAAPI